MYKRLIAIGIGKSGWLIDHNVLERYWGGKMSKDDLWFAIGVVTINQRETS